ncbi:hypothetical protein Mgra_00008710, partial [Meloidogyne graminicola]
FFTKFPLYITTNTNENNNGQQSSTNIKELHENNMEINEHHSTYQEFERLISYEGYTNEECSFFPIEKNNGENIANNFNLNYNQINE